MIGWRSFAAGLVALSVLTTAFPAAAGPAGTVPVRIRVIKGSRQGPAAIDPRLADVSVQLGRLSYQRWEEVTERSDDMTFAKPVSLPLPDGAVLELTLVDSRKDTVTFDVRVPAHHTHSRLTISKDKRIVHQVTDEKNGEAYFVTVKPWP